MCATLSKSSLCIACIVAWAVFSNVALAEANPPPVPDGPWHMMHDWSTWGGMWFGPIWMIAWLAVLVAIVIGVVRWLGLGGDAGRPERTARDILDERYARGEIDREEYLKRKQDITS
jgi:putative membrane protein